jgi:hypothetical protein
MHSSPASDSLRCARCWVHISKSQLRYVETSKDCIPSKVLLQLKWWRCSTGSWSRSTIKRAVCKSYRKAVISLAAWCQQCVRFLHYHRSLDGAVRLDPSMTRLGLIDFDPRYTWFSLVALSALRPCHTQALVRMRASAEEPQVAAGRSCDLV